jgi:hypothetical protein
MFPENHKWKRAFPRDFERLTAQLRDTSLNHFVENVKTNPIPRQPIENAQPAIPRNAPLGDYSPSGSPH